MKCFIKVNLSKKSSILLVFIILLFWSCKKKKSAEIEKTENIEILYKDETLEIAFNDKIRDYLSGGIWVSKQYDSLLKATNSLAKTEAKLKTYSDIIYNGDSLLHCNYPYYQEELQFNIFNDLSVGYRKNEIDFKIIEINSNEMIIRNAKGNNFKYYKIEKDIEKQNIFQQIVEGHVIQEKEWFSGRYSLIDNGKIYNLVIDKDGKVKGSSPYKKCMIYSWYEDDTEKEYDVLVFKTPFRDENYMVEKVTDNFFYLQKINRFDGVGESAVQQNSKVILEKDIEENNEVFGAILLDELADENYTEPTLLEINTYVKETLAKNSDGSYNLDSLQKVYQDMLPKSKFITVDNSLSEELYEKEKQNVNYFNSGGITNNTQKNIVMPEHKMYYIFVSDKNKVFSKLMYDNPFYKEIFKPNESSIYDDNWVYFLNGEQVLIDYEKGTLIPYTNSIFNDEMNTGETYLYYVKLETEKGAIFYSDITTIKCKKEYDNSELQKVEKNIFQFDNGCTKLKEYIYDKGVDKQVLQLVFVDSDRCLFKLTTNTQTCDIEIIGKANDLYHNDLEYYLENKSEVKKLIFNKEKTKVKIVMNDNLPKDFCCLIKGTLDLVKR